MEYIHFLNGDFADKSELGNKGANLVTMTRLGLPVPPGFVVPVAAYKRWQETGLLPDDEIEDALAYLEKEIGRKLGQGLEVSVRSSAPVSMPGMMDTILNVRDKDHDEKAPSSASSSPGTTSAPWSTGDLTRSPRPWARRPSSRRWSTATGTSGRGPAWSSAGTPAPASAASSASTSSWRRARSWSPGRARPSRSPTLMTAMPEVYRSSRRLLRSSKRHFCDMQDIEFTVESGKLYILQTRAGKRSGQAAVKIAVDLVKENVITHEEAVMRVTVEDIQGLLHKQLKSPDAHASIAKGLNAAPGAAGGRVVFDAPTPSPSPGKASP